jgi:hypothetical protein
MLKSAFTYHRLIGGKGEYWELERENVEISLFRQKDMRTSENETNIRRHSQSIKIE